MNPPPGCLNMAQLVPSNDIFALLALIQAIKMEPFDPTDAVPQHAHPAGGRRTR